MSARPRARVLHVEGDPVVRHAVDRTLREAGFRVTGAGDGLQGLAAALRGRFALVILHLELPGLSGLEICRRLRAEPRTRALPVLLSAGGADVGDRVRGLDAGADAVLVHPVAPEELVATARALVARAGPARPGPAPSPRDVASAREEALRLAVHLLRAPLSAIAINAASLAGAAADAVSRARASAVVEAHAASVQTLVELAELASLESSRTPLPREPRGPAELAAGAARRAAAAAEHAGVAVRVDAPATPPVRCDPARVEQALEGILRRALRTAQRGATVTLRAAPAGDAIRFTVEGGKPGGDDARAQLGQDPWSVRLARGAPELVGLALARAIVGAHGGRLVVEASPAVLHLELPVIARERA